jgi:hypothetical protein
MRAGQRMQFRNMCFLAIHIKIEGLVKITVKKVAVPGYGYERTAHQPLECTGIEVGGQLE